MATWNDTRFNPVSAGEDRTLSISVSGVDLNDADEITVRVAAATPGQTPGGSDKIYKLSDDEVVVIDSSTCEVDISAADTASLGGSFPTPLRHGFAVEVEVGGVASVVALGELAIISALTSS